MAGRLKLRTNGSIPSLKRYDERGRDASDPSHSDHHDGCVALTLVCAGELQLF